MCVPSSANWHHTRSSKSTIPGHVHEFTWTTGTTASSGVWISLTDFWEHQTPSLPGLIPFSNLLSPPPPTSTTGATTTKSSQTRPKILVIKLQPKFRNHEQNTNHHRRASLPHSALFPLSPSAFSFIPSLSKLANEISITRILQMTTLSV